MRSERVDSLLKTGESGNTFEPEQLRRRLAALWVAVVALAVVLSGVTAYGYLTLQKHNLQLSQLPGVQETLALASQRLEAVEGKLQAWAADWDTLQARMTGLERRVAYNRELARSEAQKQAAAVEERLRAEAGELANAMDARLTLLESGAEAERARLAQLQEDVAAARTESRRELASVREDLARGDQRVEELARVIDRERVDFEMDKNSTRELAGGVSLRITSTNVAQQKVKGWMWLLPDRKTLWVRELGIQQAYVFYRRDGSGPSELVITSVQDGGVSGYLLVPRAVAGEVSSGAPPQSGAAQPAADGAH
ncbi:MAG: hypothetical protein A3B65_03175 [Acidobacteria bacterium RIFCSPHIGHO2_02_FULL_67_57]|nr:MAG: hypothetical protein A3B65_03175 [Acidobacteria bacterium RIFCSPHIGHO2_02_FULL_67_57]